MSNKTARDSAPSGMKNNRMQLQSEITNLSAHLSHTRMESGDRKRVRERGIRKRGDRRMTKSRLWRASRVDATRLRPRFPRFLPSPPALRATKGRHAALSVGQRTVRIIFTRVRVTPAEKCPLKPPVEVSSRASASERAKGARRGKGREPTAKRNNR